MSFLKFNKSELVNLSYSLKREIILSNGTGAYCNTSIAMCNTRRYHGLLVVPLEQYGSDKFILLSSLDESLILSGRRFNLGIHCYGSTYDPKGHKYIIDFDADGAPAITYKIGEMVVKKELLFSDDSDTLMIRYTLVQAPDTVTMQIKPFLAYRNMHALTSKNDQVDSRYREVPGGIALRMYAGFPELHLQFSSPAKYSHFPAWSDGVTYSDEYRRGFDCKEDLWVPGAFFLDLKPGDSFVVSASISEIAPKTLKARFTRAAKKQGNINNMHDMLVRCAESLKVSRGGRKQICAGLSWMYTGLLRETLMSLPGLTLYATGDCDEFEEILDNLIEDEQERLFHRTTQVEAPLRLADVIGQYIAFAGEEERMWKKYGDTLKKVLESYLPGVRSEIAMHPNGLLWAQMDGVATSWMNAYVDGRPVTERAGYQVDTNSWWYNAICFALEMEARYGAKDSKFIPRWEGIRKLVEENFTKVFWMPERGYLSDYVDNDGVKPEVRPNMLIAAYVPYSPIDDEIKSSVLKTVEYELVTKRGIRTLSPRNVLYKGVYEGSQTERDLAYHNGCTRTELLAPYIDVFFRFYGKSFVKKAQWLVEGFIEDVPKHGVGCFSELYDGDPPHEPHGAISSACATAALLRCEYLINVHKLMKQ
ncbi:MAG: amylo-alpha-1,6-glucosidase [Bacteroidales bacterium]|nr:amylo-alpha-1,6-glucosidase [Bacteroidales bacterium]